MFFQVWFLLDATAKTGNGVVRRWKPQESLEMGKKGIPYQPETVPVCVSPDLTGVQWMTPGAGMTEQNKIVSP